MRVKIWSNKEFFLTLCFPAVQIPQFTKPQKLHECVKTATKAHLGQNFFLMVGDKIFTPSTNFSSKIHLCTETIHAGTRGRSAPNDGSRLAKSQRNQTEFFKFIDTSSQTVFKGFVALVMPAAKQITFRTPFLNFGSVKQK